MAPFYKQQLFINISKNQPWIIIDNLIIRRRMIGLLQDDSRFKDFPLHIEILILLTKCLTFPLCKFWELVNISRRDAALTYFQYSHHIFFLITYRYSIEILEVDYYRYKRLKRRFLVVLQYYSILQIRKIIKIAE